MMVNWHTWRDFEKINYILQFEHVSFKVTPGFFRMYRLVVGLSCLLNAKYFSLVMEQICFPGLITSQAKRCAQRLCDST